VQLYTINISLSLGPSVLNSIPLHSQSWISSNRYTGTDDINIIQSISDINNSTIVLGHFIGTIYYGQTGELTSNGGRDYLLNKFNSDGDLEWITAIGGSGNDFILGGVGTDSDNNIYVTGGFRNEVFFTPTESLVSSGLLDIFLAKYDTNGNLQWYKNIGSGARLQRPTTLSINSNNNIVLAGTFADSITIDVNTTLYSDNVITDYFYGEFDTNGDLQWVKQIKASYNTLSGTIFGIGVGVDHYTMTGVFSDTVFIENDTLSSISELDVHVLRTDLQGDVEWIRRIQGDGYVYSYTIGTDPENNSYVAGYYNSPSLTVDSTETETITISSNEGDYDFFVAKYSSLGILQWIRTNGGPVYDKLFDIEYFANEIHVCGYFGDTIMWGGIELSTEGPSDRDMFIGSMDVDGNYRSANSYGGRNNSSEEAFSVSLTADRLITTIRSNSDLLILGDSVYTSTTGKFYIAIGVIGCLPISVDNTIPTNISGCYGDSTGSIQVVASGGFGTPWQYSIDNGDSYTVSAFYSDLPAGDYQVVVIDAENCTEVGPLITLTEPDSLEAILVSSEDILHHTTWNGLEEVTDGSLVVTATGGTSPYTFQLLPGGTPQVLGTYYFAYADSGKYVVAVDDLHNCGPVETDTIEINVVYTDATGIGDSEGIEAKIYPNPTSGIVNIEVPFAESECEMEVLNVTGQTVLKRQVYTSGGIIKETLDLSNQAKGLYMLRIDGRNLRSAIAVK